MTLERVDEAGLKTAAEESASVVEFPSARVKRLLWQGVFLIMLLTVAICMVSSDAQGGGHQQNSTLTLTVDLWGAGRPIPDTLFGIFFEEINHAGAGGIWAELVQNRGFEAGGPSTPSSIDPWYPVGDQSQVTLSTELVSCFERNPVALRLDVLCGKSSNPCPAAGVGVANPGFWGMDIVNGSEYQVVLWLYSKSSVDLSIGFTSSDGHQTLAQEDLSVSKSKAREWNKHELILRASSTDHKARLVVLSNDAGTVWLDQISVMPVDTFKGHGFRKELATMVANLSPGFFRFPGGCYVEGERLVNAWRWRETVGPWQERPGHFGDVWNYWSDDGLGFFEYLQLAEDLDAIPVWVFNNGISHVDEISTSLIGPFVTDTLHGIEFARGPATSTWGSLRASMGHPEPFPLQYIAVGNEDCWRPNYEGNYLEFYAAIKAAYPDMYVISNCDATTRPLHHPADLYDFHIYTNAKNLFAMTQQFDHVSRVGPKVFVSEYAVTGTDSGTGSLLAALAEAAFMIGLERNSDIVEMASYAPLFVNEHDRRWNPDAIVFNSWQQYGTPSYWVQHLFRHSNGAMLLPFNLDSDIISSSVVVASVLRRHNRTDDTDFLVIKVVNLGADILTLHVGIEGLQPSGFLSAASTLTLLSSESVKDENSFTQPEKVVPKRSKLANPGAQMDVLLPAHSIIYLDLQLDPVMLADT